MHLRKDSLLSLPNELLEQILVLVAPSDVIICSQACRRLYTLVTNSVKLEYKIECHISRILDGGSRFGGISLRDRLRGVRQSRRAWRTLKPTSESCIRPTDGAMEIFGSLYMQRTDDGTGIMMHELPSPSRHVQSRNWALPSLDSPFVDFTFDETQDLLVTVDKQMDVTRLHILAASTGKVHPKTSKKFVSVTHNVIGYDDSDIRVYANLIAFIASEGNFYNQDFYVWDWKEGSLLVHLFQQAITWPQPKVYFTIWDDKRIVIPIPDPLADGAQLAIFNCYEQRGLHASFQSALASAEYTLNLPRLGPHIYYDLIDICRDTSTMHPSHLRPDVAFCPDHRARLFAVTIYMEDSLAERTLEYRLMVPWETINKQLHGRRRVIPWKTWCHDTRLLGCAASPENQPLIFGACAGRYVTMERLNGKNVAVVYDFPSKHALRMDFANADPDDTAEYVFEPTVVEESRVWAEKFQTALPYRRIMSDIVLEEDEYLMISEDCLLIHTKDDRKPIRVISF